MPRDGEPDGPCIFSCSVNDVATVASQLRTVAFKKRCWFEITTEGVRCIVEVGRSVQASVFLARAIFSDFHYEIEDETMETEEDDSKDTFEVDLGILLECLNIFGSAAPLKENNFKGKGKRRGDDSDEEEQQPQYQKRESSKRTAMRMSYGGRGHPLVLLLEEGGTVTRCDIITLDPEPLLDLSFDDEERLVKVIMKSEYLRDALSEFDPSCERLTFTFSPTPKKRKRLANGDASNEANGTADAKMRIEAQGNTGSAEMDFPYDREIIESFNATRSTPVSSTFPFSNLLHAKHAMAMSSKTSLRLDPQGLLSLQFMLPSVAGGASGFVEFVVRISCAIFKIRIDHV